MIRINKSKEELNEICKEYAEFVKSSITSSTGAKLSSNEFGKWFMSKINEILVADYDEIINIIAEFDKQFGKTKGVGKSFDEFKDIMAKQYKRIFNLPKGSVKFAYWLSSSLNVNVCLYCNRQYTFTVCRKDGKAMTRPQFDHFYNKSDNPFLALSFWNLIPVCYTCNHIKGKRKIEIHPYLNDFDKKKFAVINPIKSIIEWKTEVKIEFIGSNGKADTNIKELGLLELYNQHSDLAQEVIFKALTYNEEYFNSLKKSFGELKLSESEMKRIIFGNYIAPEDYGKRPLSKFTADILKQFKVDLK